MECSIGEWCSNCSQADNVTRLQKKKKNLDEALNFSGNLSVIDSSGEERQTVAP